MDLACAQDVLYPQHFRYPLSTSPVTFCARQDQVHDRHDLHEVAWLKICLVNHYADERDDTWQAAMLMTFIKSLNSYSTQQAKLVYITSRAAQNF